MKIGDLYWALRADGAQLEPDMQKAAKLAGDKAGKTLGVSMSGALKLGLRAGLGAIASGSAIALKGLTELSSITADFAAETGASADEADRAGKAINAMAGRNLQPMREIGDALTKVHTDLGLTGEAAEKTTEAFLRYATATRQNAASAVKDFDDILDAWGLTAEDAQGIMDKLIVAHQKYGGSIEQNQKDLANLAPQLKGLNLSIDDGIGLLDLFAASGLDASKAQFALNSAIQKLPPGTSLNDVIKKLSAIEDPAKRADEAIKIFGARGGAALANVLRPGVNSLADFAIGADEAAGATDKAADAIQSAFPNWIALRIKSIGSAIIGLGQTLGPLGSALTGIISLGGALGLDKALAGVWKAAGSSALVKGAIAAASDRAATVYLKALFAGDAISGALAAVWGRLIALPMVGAAIAAAGTAAGTLFSAAMSAAILAAPLVVVTVVAKYVVDNGLPGVSDSSLGKQQQAFLERQKAAFEKAGAETGKAAAVATSEAYGDELIARAKTTVAPAVTLAVKGAFGSDLAARSSLAQAFGRRLSGAVADGIKSQRDAWDAAWNDFLDALKNVETPAKRAARLLGRLSSKELASGLNDSRPEVKARAEEVLQTTVDELGQIVSQGGKIGKDGMNALKKAMKSKNPEIRAAATTVYNAAIHGNGNKGPASLPASGTTYGKNFIGNVIAGMNSQQKALALASAGLAGIARDHFQLSSPAKLGPWSKKGGPEGWGRRFTEFLTRGMVSGLPDVNAAMARGLRMPDLRPMSFAMSGVSPLSGSIGGVTNTYNLTANVEGLVKARDPLEIARTMGRFARTGSLRKSDD